MSIIITDEDAERLLSIPEAIEAMRVAFRDLSDGRAVNPPRLRYSAGTPIAKGLVQRENVHERGDIVAGKAALRRDPGGIVFYKNNTGLAMQFAACGASCTGSS
jgi:ornithine cyclodeaminase/alanine dehydrogenase-like protein (mu-crystallin family)